MKLIRLFSCTNLQETTGALKFDSSLISKEHIFKAVYVATIIHTYAVMVFQHSCEEIRKE